MNIQQILINQMQTPIGFQLDHLQVSYTVSAEAFTLGENTLTIREAGVLEPVYHVCKTYDQGRFPVELPLKPRTRYEVTVSLTTPAGSCSGETFFETGKMQEAFTGDWIAHPDKELQNTLFAKHFTLSKPVAQARLYMTALGVYETYLDEAKVGDEYLAPGVTDYNQWIQVQTYDVTEALQQGEQHEWLISTGDGWYKGTIGFDGGHSAIFGDQHRAIGELHVTYTDGSKEVIVTDDSWQATAGKVTKSAIYYGEDLDDTQEITDWQPVILLSETKDTLQDRLSLPIQIMEYLPEPELLTTPAGETVLDFHQNQAGWLEFYNREPKGTRLTFQMGEILQEGNFYRDNLREARAAFVYISDGEEKWVRPHFTYYGYRYVKVSGNSQPLETKNFRGAVMYSAMTATGDITTDRPQVNRLFANVQWGQKSNFFDSPTDCPQRDERLGWTGDANVFCNTAAFNMNTFAFFKKYLKDVAAEQHLFNGRAPMYAPSFGNLDGGAAVWGDAATMIPWQMYQVYGDSAILQQNYQEMKDWVDWISRNTKTQNLWCGTFQFGDWLALDGENPALPTGKTDEDFIASVYYHHSATIVAKTAALLGHSADEAQYSELATRIKQAIQAEYLTPTGRLAIDTQTAYAVALAFDLVPAAQIKRVVTDLVTRLTKDQDHLKTGFVGTPFICQVLSKYGEHKLATKIFLQEDLPSWLYAVNMGATTIWERWNSVEPDGSMNPEGMNSLNHYSIGAIMEWAYKYVLGIREHSVGYQKVTFAPEFDYRLKKISGHFDTGFGRLAVSYVIEQDANHRIAVNLTVPFGMTVTVQLPRTTQVIVNGEEQDNGFELTCGQYTMSYLPTADYVERYTPDTTAAEIMADAELVAKIDAIDPVLDFFRRDPDAVKGGLGRMSLTKLNTLLPFINIPAEHLAQINGVLKETPILSERGGLQ